MSTSQQILSGKECISITGRSFVCVALKNTSTLFPHTNLTQTQDPQTLQSTLTIWGVLQHQALQLRPLRVQPLHQFVGIDRMGQETLGVRCGKFGQGVQFVGPAKYTQMTMLCLIIIVSMHRHEMRRYLLKNIITEQKSSLCLFTAFKCKHCQCGNIQKSSNHFGPLCLLVWATELDPSSSTRHTLVSVGYSLTKTHLLTAASLDSSAFIYSLRDCTSSFSV